MSVDLGFIDIHVREHVAELIREAEHERLIELARPRGRPLRIRCAEWLHALAERVEGEPHGSVAGAESLS